MKEYLKAIPATTIIIIYLYLCGGLYLIAFWSTFDFDISNIVSVVDIPKNFIFPFILSNILIILQLGSNIVADKHSNTKTLSAEAFNTRKKKINYFIIVVVAALTPTYLMFKQYPEFWIAACFVLMFLLQYKFVISYTIIKIIPNYTLRYYFAHVFVLVPMFCIMTGKTKSLNIYNNTDIKYININSIKTKISISDSASLKLLGFLGDKLIIGSLDNKQIFVLNQEMFDAVELDKKEDK